MGARCGSGRVVGGREAVTLPLPRCDRLPLLAVCTQVPPPSPHNRTHPTSHTPPCRQYDRAWRALDAGNRLQDAQSGYDPARDEGTTATLKATFWAPRADGASARAASWGGELVGWEGGVLGGAAPMRNCARWLELARSGCSLSLPHDCCCWCCRLWSGGGGAAVRALAAGGGRLQRPSHQVRCGTGCRHACCIRQLPASLFPVPAASCTHPPTHPPPSPPGPSSSWGCPAAAAPCWSKCSPPTPRCGGRGRTRCWPPRCQSFSRPSTSTRGARSTLKRRVGGLGGMGGWAGGLGERVSGRVSG